MGTRFTEPELLSERTRRARDSLNGRLVLLKDGTPTDLAREVEVSLQLRHRAFRRTYGWHAGSAVFEFVEGEAPRQEQVDECAIELLRALLRLHRHGFAHADLKPENLLWSPPSGGHAQHRLRVLDLGMAMPFGSAPCGGSPSFMAPELASGKPLSVASDLFAFGMIMQTLSAKGVLADLANQCIRLDPEARPASAGSCLAMLGMSARANERVDGLELPIEVEPSRQVLVGEAPERAEEVLLGSVWRAGREAVVLRFDRSVTPLAAFCRYAGVQHGSLAARCRQSMAALRVPVVVRGSWRADPDARAALEQMMRAAQVIESSLYILDADEALGDRLGHAGASRANAATYDKESIAALGEAYGATLSAGAIDTLHARTQGAPSVVRLIERLAIEPTRHAEEVCAEVDDSGAGEVILAGEELVTEVAAAVAAGAGHRALRLLDASPAGDGSTHVSLRAQALALAGRLPDAVDMTEVDTKTQVHQATWLVRLGRFEQAEALALRLDARGEIDGTQRAELICTRALAARDAGHLERARTLAVTAEAMATSDPQRMAATLIAADVATTQGKGSEALLVAEHALRFASTDAERSQGEARRGAALATQGEWGEAENAYLRAYSFAREAGDPLGLPAFEVNRAAAAHALGRFGDAIAGYERAADLARKLDRIVSVAAALTNLAGLYVAIRANGEARDVIARAREACAASGYALYDAQCDLIEGESWQTIDVVRARRLALAAQSKFEAIGAARQVAETGLFLNELSLRDPPPDPEAVPRLDEPALARAGLSTRLSIHQARMAQRDGAVGAARTLSARAREESVNPLERVEAGELLADCMEHLGEGAASALRTSVRQERETIAVALPAGLRRRFDPSPPQQTRERGLGEPARRLVSLARRVLLEHDESRVYAAALDEAVAITGAERAFLLQRAPRGTYRVLAARNLDGEHVRKSSRRFSRSIVKRVLETGESMVVAQAGEDPELSGFRSVHAMGLRSVLCVPIRSHGGSRAVLYLDHRFTAGTFGPHEQEWLSALGDIVGLGLENARLHRVSQERESGLAGEADDARRMSEHQAVQIARLEGALASDLTPSPDEIVGNSSGMRDARRLARKVAPSMLPVLIEGESGTGKELFARLVHRASLRASGPMLAVNCGAFAETLLESELFGHVRGAFTGAISDHPGLFRSADGGTLLLDEVGEMPLRMQSRLLRVLQESEVRPVGGTKSLKIDVRVVAATNRDLAGAIRDGTFRQDLFYRLAGVRLTLPPLRERKEDIADLVAGVVARMASSGQALRLTSAAMRSLLAYDYPGNVRELEQLLRSAALVAENDVVDTGDLFPSPAGVPRRVAHLRLDRSLIAKALSDAKGNKTEAARHLGVSRVTLYRWIKRHDL